MQHQIQIIVKKNSCDFKENPQWDVSLAEQVDENVLDAFVNKSVGILTRHM